MKKFLTFVLICFMALVMVACSGKQGEDDSIFDGISFNDATFNYNASEHAISISGTLPDGADVIYTNNSATEEGTYNATATLKKGSITKTLNATLKIVEPTPAQVVSARANTVKQNIQGFDYRYTLSGHLSVLGLGIGNVDGIDTGQYRENKTTGNYEFKRVTSGDLLMDSVKYAYNKGNQRIIVKMDENGSIKKTSIETVDAF